MDKRKYLFESKRIGFRNWEDQDLTDFSAINSDPIVMAKFPNKLTIDETKAFIERLKTHYEKHSFTFFAIDLLESQEIIGFIGLVNTKFKADFTPCVEIGWRLKKEIWNQGLATEGAKRCLEYAFKELNMMEIYSFTPISNIPSQRVMQKIGMTKVSEFKHPSLAKNSSLLEHVLYCIESPKKFNTEHLK